MIREEKSDLIRGAHAASEKCAADVLESARRYKTPVIVWRNGRILELDPDSPEFEVVKPAKSSASE